MNEAILTTARKTEGRNNSDMVGIIKADPVYRSTQDRLYCNFDLVVPGRSDGDKETIMPVKVASTTLSEICKAKNLTKGTEIQVVGRIVSHSKYRSMLELLAHTITPVRELWL